MADVPGDLETRRKLHTTLNEGRDDISTQRDNVALATGESSSV